MCLIWASDAERSTVHHRHGEGLRPPVSGTPRPLYRIVPWVTAPVAQGPWWNATHLPLRGCQQGFVLLSGLNDALRSGAVAAWKHRYAVSERTTRLGEAGWRPAHGLQPNADCAMSDKMREYALRCHALREAFNRVRTPEDIRLGRDYTMMQHWNGERWVSTMPASHPDHPSWRTDSAGH